jgi:uncharacterized protein
MLTIDIADIPAEGLEVDERLEAAEVHVENEESFGLEAGGRLVCRMERSDDQSIHVRGRLQAQLRVNCSRCLEPFAFPVSEDLDFFYLPHRPEEGVDEEEDEVQLSDHEMVVTYYHGRSLDLGDMIREQFFLAVPMKRLCRENCAGLCSVCGANRNLRPCECRPDPDLRLAGLKTLFDKEPQS